MTTKLIEFTKQTPSNSKKYLIEFLTKNNVNFNLSEDKNGLVIYADNKTEKRIRDRLSGFIHYCSMIEG